MKKINCFAQNSTFISFVLYLALLTWIIVFKFRLDLSSLAYIRSVNLIPFKETGMINGISGGLFSLGLFIPLGMYLEFLIKGKGRKAAVIILLVSLVFETFQYVFHIGVSDITDVIMNFAGGVIGMIAMGCIYKLLLNSPFRRRASMLSPSMPAKQAAGWNLREKAMGNRTLGRKDHGN